MQEQLSLFDRRIRQADDDVAALSSYLYGVRGWRTRAQIARAIGWNERRIRLAGENSRGKIIFGQRGLRHSHCASIEEIRACCATLFSQARRNTQRGIETMREYHKMAAPPAILQIPAPQKENQP